ncbi:molybdopterin-binding protein [Sulfurospirillum sp. 1307]
MQFSAKIIDIKENDSLHVVWFELNHQKFCMMSLELHDVKIGAKVVLSIKPLNIALAKGDTSKISFINELKAKVVSIEEGELLLSVRLDFEGNLFESVLLRESKNKLDLKEGDEVVMLIKANEISIKEVIC